MFTRCVLPVLLLLPRIFVCSWISPTVVSEKSLEYLLTSIEYEASISPGSFRCVFYEVSSSYSTENTITKIMGSPKLDHVLKNVLSGPYSNDWVRLPLRPSLLLIHPGDDIEYLQRNDTIWNLYYLLQLFDPTTKVLVLVDQPNYAIVRAISVYVFTVRYSYLVCFDSQTMWTVLCNALRCNSLITPPHPIYLFRWAWRNISGRNVTYYIINGVSEEPSLIQLNWVTEVARYLKTEAKQHRTNCSHHRDVSMYYHCVGNQNNLRLTDVHLSMTLPAELRPRSFQQLITTIPVIAKIGVPRDRPVNAIELMLMPFSWPVWLVIVTILVLSEVAKLQFPNLFENDPILLVLCGYEQHNLHQASRREKMILLALIVLMFFMTNAFETKVISLMINRPSIQRIQTIDDLFKSDVKFYHDIESCPNALSVPILGKLIVQGEHDFYEIIPGAGKIVLKPLVDVLNVVAYDYERMQPFYVFLEPEFIIFYESYITSNRYPYLQVFRLIHITLTEAGLFDQWLSMWKLELRFSNIGRRAREDITDKVVLTFADMQPAWVALAIGTSVSLIGFAGEILAKKLKYL